MQQLSSAHTAFLRSVTHFFFLAPQNNSLKPGKVGGGIKPILIDILNSWIKDKPKSNL